MLRVYCYTTKEARPVYAAAFDTLEEAEIKMNDLVAQARLAKALGSKGDRTLASIYKVAVKSEEGNILASAMRDEEETDAAEPQD